MTRWQDAATHLVILSSCHWDGLFLASLYLRMRAPGGLTQPLHRIQCAGNDKNAVQENRRHARGRLADHAAAPPPLRAVSRTARPPAATGAAVGCRRHAVFLGDDGLPEQPGA